MSVKRFFLFMAILCTVVLLGFVFVFFTETGTRIVINTVLAKFIQNAHAEKISGKFGRFINLQKFAYEDDNYIIKAEEISITWRPFMLIKKKLVVSQCKGKSISVIKKSNAPKEVKLSEEKEVKVLPLQVQVDDLDFIKVSFSENGTSIFAENLSISGMLNMDDFRVTAGWRNAHIERSLKAIAASVEGDLQAQGTLAVYTVEGMCAFSGEFVPDARLKFKANGTGKGISLEKLAVDTLDGSITGEGSVAWMPELAWDLNLYAKRLLLEKKWDNLQGIISFGCSTKGVSGQKINGIFLIKDIEGSMQHQQLKGSARIEIKDNYIVNSLIKINAGEAKLFLKGGAAALWDLVWEINIPSLSKLLRESKGLIIGSGSILGERNKPQIQGTLYAEQVSIMNAGVARSRTEFFLDMSKMRTSTFRCFCDNLNYGDTVIKEVSLDAQGSETNHEIKLNLIQNNYTARIVFVGGYNYKLWEGKISQAEISSDRFGLWNLRDAARLSISRDQQLIDGICMMQNDSEICGNLFRSNSGALNLQGTISRLPLTVFETWYPESLNASGLVQGLFEYKADRGFHSAHVQLTSEKGSVSYESQKQKLTSLNYSNADVEVLSDNDKLKANITANLADGDNADISLEMTPFNTGPGFGKNNLNGKVNIKLSKLEFVSSFVPYLTDVSGILVVNADITGTVSQPVITGLAQIEKGMANLRQIGIKLSNAGIKCNAGQDQHIDFLVVSESGTGNLKAEGSAVYTKLPLEYLDTSINGNLFELINLPELQLIVSPKLNAKYFDNKFDISGNVAIPKAKLTIPEIKAGAVPTSDDVVFEDEKEEQSKRKRAFYSDMRIDVKVTFGDNVVFEGYGLKAKIYGNLRLIQEAGKSTLAQGELRVAEGSYTAYGQKLKIIQGKVIFEGPVTNPEIDVKAIRQTGSVVAGIRVTGMLRSPQITLFSEPAMSQADMLSYLLLGRPLKQASTKEGRHLTNAIAVLQLAGGQQLTKYIGRYFGLEEIQFESSPSTGETSLILGRPITSKLYMNYVMTPFSTGAAIRFRYYVNPKLTLQAESGQLSGMDALFNFDY
ncbi:MAG: translocation/assembly module TamB domain-containing protein [bacterium]